MLILNRGFVDYSCCIYAFFFSGMLEWQDKKGVMQGPSARITRSLQCMVSIARTDQDM